VGGWRHFSPNCVSGWGGEISEKVVDSEKVPSKYHTAHEIMHERPSTTSILGGSPAIVLVVRRSRTRRYRTQAGRRSVVREGRVFG
jgi:hypothetical protein